MKTAATYINFDGNCREAMTFYKACLAGDLHVTAFPDDKGKPSADPAAKIMHSHVSKDGKTIVQASDTPSGGVLKPGNNFSVSIDCDSVDEIERLFAAFGQGGQVRCPLGNMPWGARFGMLTDRFGIQWMFNCNLAPKRN